MKTRKLLLLLPMLGMLFACNSPTKEAKPGRDYGDDGLYALYMYNYPRTETTSPKKRAVKMNGILTPIFHIHQLYSMRSGLQVVKVVKEDMSNQNMSIQKPLSLTRIIALLVF